MAIAKKKDLGLCKMYILETYQDDMILGKFLDEVLQLVAKAINQNLSWKNCIMYLTSLFIKRQMLTMKNKLYF